METLFHSIESFPPLPESIQKLNQVCSHQDVDFKVVAKIIESDPILYTDILRYSNAPYHGLHRPVTSIMQAIALFGISGIRGMSLTAVLKAHPYNDLSMYAISIHEWFKTMEKQQRFLDLWLLKQHRALLHAMGGLTFILEIGRLVVSYALMISQKNHFFNESMPIRLGDEEKEIIGYSGDVLAAKLFQHWNFDPFFCNTLYHSLIPQEGMDPESCAALQCARTLYTIRGDNEFNDVVSLLEDYRFKVDEAKSAYEMEQAYRKS